MTVTKNKNDIQVKCTRCRNNHLKSERKDVLDPKAKDFITYNSTCPRCGCKSYYNLSPKDAWCWASGLIEIGDELPAGSPDGSGVIQIASGPEYALNAFLDVLAQHGKGASKGKWLVPGVPEAPDGDAALEALEAWLKWCGSRKAMRDGITLSLGGRAE